MRVLAAKAREGTLTQSEREAIRNYQRVGTCWPSYSPKATYA
jgi:hypothetical protein